MKKALDLIVRGGNARRYHTCLMHQHETVGHHSFLVAWLVALLYKGDPPAALLLAALQHDLAECETGDIPAPFKRRVEGLRDQFNAHEESVLLSHGVKPLHLTAEEQRVLKLADSLSGMLHCVQERSMGNQNIEQIYRNFYSYASGLACKGAEVELFDTVTVLWEKAHERK